MAKIASPANAIVFLLIVISTRCSVRSGKLKFYVECYRDLQVKRFLLAQRRESFIPKEPYLSKVSGGTVFTIIASARRSARRCASACNFRFPTHA